MKKRINSLFLTLVMTLTCVLPFLTACSPKSAADGTYTAAEWLSKVEDGFNLNYYTNDEPVMQNVLRDDPKFSIVQTAVEWGLMDVEDNVDLDAPITKEFCADTLVCAMNFTDPAAVEIKDEDKINTSYLENVKIALENGVFKLESGKFDPVKKLSKEEADEAFDIAHDKWVNFSFTESYDKSVTKENVVNLGGLSEEVSPIVKSDYSVEYSGSRQFFSGDQYVDNTTKTITFKPDKIPEGLKAGSVLSMPADEVVPMDYAVVVDSITENEDGSVTVNTHNAELADVFEEYNVQMHEDVDFSKARIFGPDGTEIKPDTPQAVPMMNTSSLMSLSLDRKALSSKNKSYSLPLSNKADVKIKVNGTRLICTIDYNDTIKGNNSSCKVGAQFIGDIGANIDYSFDGGLFYVNKAYAKCTLDTNTKTTLSINADAEYDMTRLLKDDDKALSDFYNGFSASLTDQQSASKTAGRAMSRKLGEIVLPYGFTLVLRANLSIEGKLTITFNTAATFGFNYRNKKIQAIHDLENERSADLSGKIEATLFGGLTWSPLGFCIADCGVLFGVGAVTKTTIFHKSMVEGEYDEVCALPASLGSGSDFSGDIRLSGYSLETSDQYARCFDLKVYPILNLELITHDCFIGKFVKGLNYQVFGEDQAFCDLHFEDSGLADGCTRGITNTVNIETGKDLELNLNDPNKIVVSVGEEYKGLKIKTLPEGISTSDITVSVADPDILHAECLINTEWGKMFGKEPKSFMEKMAQSMMENKSLNELMANVDVYYLSGVKKDIDHFSLTGLSDGVTKLTVKAGTFSKTIDVVVGNGGIKEASVSRFVLSDTLVNLTGNGSHKLSVTTAPEGYTMADFSFSSDNPEIASVDSTGVITAQNVTGSTIVYVSSNDGKYTSACMVLVTEGASFDSNAAAAGAGGAGAFGGGSGGGVR